jgi:hypothetical protein
MKMRGEKKQPDGDRPGTEQDADHAILQNRRSMLRIGALSAAAIVTVRPGIAPAAVTSALTCGIPIPLAADAGKWVKKDGTIVNPNTANAWAFPSQPLKGEDVKNAIKYGTSIPGTVSNQTKGYLAYIDAKITAGKPGFTCYASLQSPNRY